MKHYMKKVYPERSRLIPGTSISECRNVQILPIRRKRGAGVARGWRGYGAGADKLTI